ncbi:MAG: hypothetical protein GY903_06595 [Fuerstiella sp.]|nr:hypothetical protein [Fuerstiella sp.]MCP4854143.1 hypothetical protein [Fuerstiella sp.]
MKMKIQNLLLAAGAALAFTSPLAAQDRTAANPFEEDNILAIMHKVNDYAKAHPYRKTDRNWIRGTWYAGVMEAYYATGDASYLEQAREWAEKHQWKVGTEESGFNRLFCSMTWAELNLIEPDPKKIAPTIDALNADLPYAPVVGKVWYGHQPRPNDVSRVYADGLFSAPTLAMLHKATGDQKYLEFLHDAFWTVTEEILDKDDDLYYRDPSYIGKKSPNGGKVLWSRGNGWVFAGLPRIIKHLSRDDPHYDRYIDLYRRMAKALALRQDDDGFWRANLGDPQHYTMPESSGTAFFIAGFGWGVREGILDPVTYLPVIIRGWNALVTAVHPDGFLGWVQPVDGQPRPSHPRTTQEYGTGLFLNAGGQVYRLVKDGAITPETIQAALPEQSQMLPPAALKDGALTSRKHPLYEQINGFMKNQQGQVITSTQFTKKDYLDVIAGQVKAMRQYQNAEGRIIDPVQNVEKYFTTPCYAHSIAVLAKAGYPIKPELVESGMKALDVSLADMVAGKADSKHGDFFTWPIMFAYELFDGSASKERKERWSQLLEQIDPRRAYRNYKEPLGNYDHKGFYAAYKPGWVINWNMVNAAGEWLRAEHGFSDPWYADFTMTMQLPNFTAFGMYNEHGDPLPYDLFARHYLTSMLQRGYSSFLHTTYRDILWRGAWTSLFMQSPFGELPTGYRSSHHIWNEAEQAVVFEVYASAYAKAGRTAEAGAFKRAAHLALSSIQNWMRPDGSGYIVKNRYPIEAKHGHEGYSVHTCYNMLAMSMLAQAWAFAEDCVKEAPAPTDVGGFVVELPRFHKIIAAAAGNHVEYDTQGDHVYNPTGLIRIHLKNGHPQLGPSDGCAQEKRGGRNLAVGPAWQDSRGNWHALADKSAGPAIEILRQDAAEVAFRATYSLEHVTVEQTIVINKHGVTVTDEVEGESVRAVETRFPALVFNGRDRTGISIDGKRATLALEGKTHTFTVLEPRGAKLKRTGKKLKHVNGMVEPIIVSFKGKRSTYRISAE